MNSKLKVVFSILLSLLLTITLVLSFINLPNLNQIVIKNWTTEPISSYLTTANEFDVNYYKYEVVDSQSVLYTSDTGFTSKLVCSPLLLNCDIKGIEKYDEEKEVYSNINFLLSGSNSSLVAFIDELEASGLFIKEVTPIASPIEKMFNSALVLLVILLILYILLYLYELNRRSKYIVLKLMFGVSSKDIFKQVFNNRRVFVTLSVANVILASVISIFFTVLCLVLYLLSLSIIIVLLLLIDVITIYLIKNKVDMLALLKGRLIIERLQELNYVYNAFTKIILFVTLFSVLALIGPFIKLYNISELWNNVEDYYFIPNSGSAINEKGGFYSELQEEYDMAFILFGLNQGGEDNKKYFTSLENNDNIEGEIDKSLIYVNENYLNLVSFNHDAIDKNIVYIPLNDKYDENSIKKVLDQELSNLCRLDIYDDTCLEKFLNYDIRWYDNFDFYAYYQRNDDDVYDPFLFYPSPIVYVSNDVTYELAAMSSSTMNNFFFKLNDIDELKLVTDKYGFEFDEDDLLSKYDQYGTIRLYLRTLMIILIFMLIPLIFLVYYLSQLMYKNYFLINAKKIAVHRILGESKFLSYKSFYVFELTFIFLVSIILLPIAWFTNLWIVYIMSFIMMMCGSYYMMNRTIVQNENKNIVAIVKGGFD